MAMTLKAARVNAGFKQRDAAKEAGIDTSTLGRYERGLATPDVILAKKLSKMYGLDLNDIIFLPKSTV